jgi:hypothetical protein
MRVWRSKETTAAIISLAASILLAACAHNSTGASGDNSSATQSQAYNDGYNLNIGVSQALIDNAGSAQAYCESILALHSEYTTSQQQDYIQGCLQVIADTVDTSSNATDSSNSYASDDLLTRLQNSGGSDWSEDPFNLNSNLAVGFKADYLSDGCTVWVFDSQDSAQATYDNGFFDSFTSYNESVGTDNSTGDGIIAMMTDTNSYCSSDMLNALGWNTFGF